MTNDSESLHIWLSKPVMGPLLNDEDIARAFAAMILKRLYGEAELAKQQPLRVADQGESWIVEGSFQEPGRLRGTGRWFVRMRKSDCRVETYGHCDPWDIPDEVKAAIERAKGTKPR